MAELKVIANAKIQSYAIEKIFGERPELDIQEDYVRLYYPADKLPKVQKKFELIMKSPPGPVRYDLQPILNPYMIKKLGLPIVGVFAVAYLIGRYF